MLYTCSLYVELEMTVQVDNGAPVEGVDMMVELCVVVSSVNASETDLTVTLIATDGLAAGEVVLRPAKRNYLRNGFMMIIKFCLLFLHAVCFVFIDFLYRRMIAC